jgi:hypothetical protein
MQNTPQQTKPDPLLKLPFFQNSFPKSFFKSQCPCLLPSIWRREKTKSLPVCDFFHAPHMNNTPENEAPLLLTQEKTLEKSPLGRGRRVSVSWANINISRTESTIPIEGRVVLRREVVKTKINEVFT